MTSGRIRADPRRRSTPRLRGAGCRRLSATSWRRTRERRAAQTALQEKQARRNALSKEIGQGRRTGADTAALEAEATALRDEMAALE